MLTSKFLACVLAAIVFLLPVSQSNVFAQEVEAGTLRNFKIGEKLPPIKLPAVNDDTLQSFTPGNGKPAVIMFFSIRPDFRKKRSLALLSTLTDFADQYKTKIDIVGIYSDSEQVDTVQTYMAKSNLNIRVYNDAHKRIYNTYGVFMMPLVILSDEDGKLHEIIPYTYNIREIVDGNIKLLLKEWDRARLIDALKPKETIIRSPEEKEYIRRVNYGRIMMSRKMYGQAVREFSNAVKMMPHLIRARVGLGFALLESRKYDEAEASFKEALKIDPDSDDAIAGLGLTHYRQGKIDIALTELENAFIVPKPDIEVIITLAEIYEKKGASKKAIRLNKLAVSRLMTLFEQRWK